MNFSYIYENFLGKSPNTFMDSHRALHLTALYVILNLFSTCHGFNTITSRQCISDAENTYLVSPNGKFKLGFFSPGKSRAHYVGIWFNKIPDQTVVWVANRATPIKNSDGVFKIDTDGNLGVFCCNQSSPLWSTNASMLLATSNSTAKLLDSGNLVLIAKGRIVWQSFDYPTDTIISGMKFGWNLKTGINHILTSWKSVDDPAQGQFSAVIDTHSQLVIYKNSVTYRRSGPWNGIAPNGMLNQNNYNISKPELVSVSVKFDSNDNEMYLTTFPKKDDVLSIWVLDSVGAVKRLLWHESQKWVSVLIALQDLCDEYARCGANTICSDDPLAYCACLPGFERLNPEDWYLKCEESTKGGCGKGDGEGFVRLEGVKFPDAKNSTIHKSISLSECESMCLQSCNCTGYANPFMGDLGHDCMIWYGELRDMKDYRSGQDFYLRVDAETLAADAQKKAKNLLSTNNKLVFIAVTIVVEMLLAALFFYYLWRRTLKKKGRKHKQAHHQKSSGSAKKLSDSDTTSDRIENENTGLTLFDLSTVSTATNNFSSDNKLGRGGFGVVYKGDLVNGQEVAVKKLSKNSGQGLVEFKNEVLLIAKLQHRNLVRMLGYCVEKDEMMLIYEFMPNKSLDNFIFDQTRKFSLDWNKRFNIIMGIARGIIYLHEDSRLKIIHRDLKVSNILLDVEMNPKISDFGLARIFGGDQTQGNTERVVGTYGYMSPEYALDGLFSTKSDVFSFGVILLEVITGKKNKSFLWEDSYSNLIQYTWELWRDGQALKIVDACIENSAPSNQQERCIQVGLLCVQDDPRARPNMSSVMSMLTNDTTLPTPKKSTFSVSRNGSSSSNIKKEYSNNQVTNTTIQAR